MRRLERGRRYRAKLSVLRDMRDFFGLPQPQRNRRPPVPQRVEQDPVVIVSSDSSEEDLPAPVPIVVDLDSSLESLPNIDPCPQLQLPVAPLEDLRPLNITLDFPPPLQHKTLREAYVLLQHLQLPQLQPLTPPPEFPPRAPTPPLDQAVDWVELEAAVAHFDWREYLVVPQPLVLQQPDVEPVPQHVPEHFAAPPPMPEVDWANIARALFSIVEQQNQQRAMNPN